jgi:BNR repeat protein
MPRPVRPTLSRMAVIAVAIVTLNPLLASNRISAAAIELTEVRLDRPNTHSFRLTLAAKGDGIEVGSYGMRTYAKTSQDLPGFVPRSGYQYLVSRHSPTNTNHLLIDGSPDDEDATAGVYSVTVDTTGWPDGEYFFLAYADNRPAPRRYVTDRSLVYVAIADGKLGLAWIKGVRLAIKNLRVDPPEVDAGESFRVSAQYDDPAAGAMEFALTCPYTVGPEEVPPGFQYDAGEKQCWFKTAQPDGSFLVSTKGWKPGVHHLTLMAGLAIEKASAKMSEYRDFSVRVRGESRFEVTVESRTLLGTGTHFREFCKLTDGSVLAHGKISRDGGRTWQPLNQIPMAHQLSSGEILGLGFNTEPVPDRPGHLVGTRFVSSDGGKTVQKEKILLHVPEATGGIGHSAVNGPLFFRSIIEQPDGRLLAAMYGWFRGDDVPVPGQPGSTYYRTFLVSSTDRGKTWAFLGTVAYDPGIGTEGYCEPSIRRLPDGDLLAMLRTGGNNRPFWQDNPLCQTRSSDGGRTWAKPHRTGVEGVAPDLCVMSDGTLACSYGRPGADLMLSTNNGRTWTDHTCIHPERYSGYTAVCEIEPGVLLYGYGVMNCLDENTGRRANQLWTARVRVKPR